MQDRAAQSYEKVNPFTDRCNWYYMVRRAMKAVFKESHEALDDGASRRACTDSRDRRMLAVEEEFLLQLAEMIENNSTEESKQRRRAALATDSTKELAARIKTTAGLQSDEVVSYSLAVVGTAVGVGPVTGVLLGLELTGAMIPALANITSAVSVNIVAMTTPLVIIGLLGLATSTRSFSFSLSFSHHLWSLLLTWRNACTIRRV